MSMQCKPPLAIHFVWHPSDEKVVEPILQAVRKYFARDVKRPFSRGLNIPLFFYSSASPNNAPDNPPSQQAERDIVFIFTSITTIGTPAWEKYISTIQFGDSYRAMPIALDREGLQHTSIGNLSNCNCLRAYNWIEALQVQNTLVAMAHEVYRFGFVAINEEAKGKSSSIQLFLSHTTTGDIGRKYAEAIKSYIDTTNMSHFFDATDIPPGFNFGKEIEKNLKESTLIGIVSDAYSASYWCQREFLYAKEQNRPILVINCLQEYEDRIFPAGANVPCVHISSEPSFLESTLPESTILNILCEAIFETIRHHHALQSLNFYQQCDWIPRDCILLARPPEMHQIAMLMKENMYNKKGLYKMCYPEPPLYAEEVACFPDFIETFTPLWESSEKDNLAGMRIGISTSEVPTEGYAAHHLHNNHLTRLAQDIARHLLARSATLLYGGDLRPDGFTQFILDEAIALKNRMKTDTIHVENHLAWPLWISAPEIIAWRAKYFAVMKTKEHKIPDVIKNLVEDKETIPVYEDSVTNKRVWASCLTKMRQSSIASSDARICAGGKLYGYKGKMPGVLEEILIALEKQKPIYLLGAFGGVVREVCKSIQNKTITPPLTEEWQIAQNLGYDILQATAKETEEHADYQAIKSIVEDISISGLATLAGLTEEEYSRLMVSPFLDECVYLILKGLKLKKENKH